MKIIFKLLFIGLTITSTLHAQKKNDDRESDISYRSEREFDPEVIAKLKATKTVFFLPDNAGPAADSFKQAVQSVWTITPLSFDTYSNFRKYESDPSYSYFIVENFVTFRGRSTFSHFYLTLKLFKEVDKKGKISSYGLCHIELSPDYEKSIAINGKKTALSSDNILKDNLFHNWTPTIIKAHLTTVVKDIEQNKRASLFDGLKDSNLKSLLSKNTLYIPKRLMLESKLFSYTRDPITDNVFEGYPYKYKVCTDEELYKIFETDKTGVVLFEFLHCEGQKWISIIDVKEGKKVYMRYSPGSRNINSQDINKLVE